jgi:hypothetical protein
MTDRRERVARQVLITAFFLAIVCFLVSSYILVSIGVWTGILKLHLLEPPPYSGLVRDFVVDRGVGRKF